LANHDHALEILNMLQHHAPGGVMNQNLIVSLASNATLLLSLGIIFEFS
jgi:hypothetical protein